MLRSACSVECAHPPNAASAVPPPHVTLVSPSTTAPHHTATAQALYQFLTMCNVRQHNPFCHMDPCPVVAAATAYSQHIDARSSAAQLCNALCACSSVGQRLPTEVLDRLAEGLLAVQGEFLPETYGRVRCGWRCGWAAGVTWRGHQTHTSCARRGCEAWLRVHACDAHATRHLACARMRHLRHASSSQVAWAYAKQEYSPLKGRLFASLYSALLEDAALLARFGEKDLSQLMWAASYLEQPPPTALMDGLARVALDKLDTFSGAVW